jgi:hypothetical protein
MRRRLGPNSDVLGGSLLLLLLCLLLRSSIPLARHVGLSSDRLLLSIATTCQLSHRRKGRGVPESQATTKLYGLP